MAIDDNTSYELTGAQVKDLASKINAKEDSADLAAVAESGSYNDLSDKPTIPAAQVNSDWDAASGVAQILNKPSLAAVATSGSYSDLSDKPTIGNATLTIQKNGTSVDTFTANATSNKTINITVPTTAADVSALPASTKYGASISVSINTTDYKVTTTLKDQDGNTLGTAQVIDLPLESVVVNGSYDNTNKKIILTLQNGNTIDIPVADLVAGLQSEITSSNKLASDLVDDTNQTNKFMTSAEKTKLSGIATGAEVNVQSDWDVSDNTSDAFIKNKPTIPTVNNGTLTIQKNGTTVQTFTANQSGDATANITVDYVKTADNLTPTADTTAAWKTAFGSKNGAYLTWYSAAGKFTNQPNAYGYLETFLQGSDIYQRWHTQSSGPILYRSGNSSGWSNPSTGAWNTVATTANIGNATLTIQKNGTAVDTFTANATSDKTVNITVPTDTNDLTNGAGYITSSGTAAKANQLTTARTIALGTGATGTATSFNGTSNITIPVTDVKDAYVTWGGKPLYSTVSPDDAGCVDEFGHNKMAFLPANCIQVHYSTDGGSTWVDYGLTDAQKIQLVTYGDVFCKTGGATAATSSNVTNLKLRIRIATAASTTTTGVGSLYTDWRKVLLNVNDPNSNCNMTMRYRTIGNYKSGTETWVDSGTTYPVRGGTAWNSIPRPSGWPAFGGNYANQTTQIGQLEFVLSNTKLGTWGDKKGSICSIRMIGMSNWAMPSEMARTGRLYTIDNNQNATFPREVALTDLHALNILPKSGDTTYRHLGRSGEEWKDVWLTDAIYANGNKLNLPTTAGTLALTSDMPTVNNATLTIQKNGTDVQTFTANSSTNKTANITVPTKTSELSNDSNFVASGDLATVATSGSYNDLSNKPTIPTVNNGTLTIQKNGTTINTFTANSSNNVTANIPVPTLSTTDTDPGEGSALAADTFLGVYDIAPTAIDGSRITNGTVTTNKLASSAVTAAKVDFSTFGVAATVNGPSSTTSKATGGNWASTDMYSSSVTLAAGTYLVVVTGSSVAFSAAGQEWFNVVVDSTTAVNEGLAWFSGAVLSGNGVGIVTVSTSGTHTVAYQLGAQNNLTATLYAGSKIQFVRIG